MSSEPLAVIQGAKLILTTGPTQEIDFGDALQIAVLVNSSCEFSAVAPIEDGLVALLEINCNSFGSSAVTWGAGFSGMPPFTLPFTGRGFFFQLKSGGGNWEMILPVSRHISAYWPVAVNRDGTTDSSTPMGALTVCNGGEQQVPFSALGPPIPSIDDLDNGGAAADAIDGLNALQGALRAVGILEKLTRSVLVTATNNPITAGVPGDNFHVSVTPDPNNPECTGTGQFTVDNGEGPVNFGTPVTLVAHEADSADLSTLAVGSYAVAFVYSGDGQYAGATGTLAVPMVVN